MIFVTNFLQLPASERHLIKGAKRNSTSFLMDVITACGHHTDNIFNKFISLATSLKQNSISGKGN